MAFVYTGSSDTLFSLGGRSLLDSYSHTFVECNLDSSKLRAIDPPLLGC
jgi:hypothetical protein